MVAAPLRRLRRDLAMGAWLRAIRLHHWSKNLVIFVPVVLAHEYSDGSKILLAAIGFLILGVFVSAGYIVNDLVDLQVDRRHRSKHGRPFASGRLSVPAGIVAAALMLVGGFCAALLLPRQVLILLCAYLALTIGYTLWLKRLALVDVTAITTMFTLRVALGAAVIGSAQSVWLLSFSWAFFLSLALAKRHCELMQMTHDGGGPIPGRGFASDDWPLTVSFGVGAGMVSIVVMLLYLANDAAPSGFYPHQGWLYVTPAAILIWLMRVWLLSHRAKLHDDPVEFAFKDPASIALGVIITVAFVLAL
jgi:4-hydroxybenzoate polyprenyltransferase